MNLIATTAQPHQEQFGRGTKQWQILDNLIQKYAAMDISDVTTGKFEDGYWELVTTGDKATLYFDKYLSSPLDLPLKICLKILVIHLIKYGQKSARPVTLAIRGFIAGFLPQIKQMTSPVLQSAKNNQWLPMGAMETTDITYSLEALARDGNLRTSITTLAWMESYQAFPDLAPFIHGLVTPWVYEKIGASAWRENLQDRAGLTPEYKAYPAISDEVVSKIIATSIPYLEGISDSVDVEKIIEEKPSKRSRLIDFLIVIREAKAKVTTSVPTNQAGQISKNQDFLNGLQKANDLLLQLGLPPVYETHTKYKSAVKTIWLSSLFNRAQEAALWIVALTTGLRNSDLRNLQTDCLHYSERFSIWFVRADLQKTNNTIYIPVGSPTVKAIRLLKWLRLSDGGNSLIQRAVFYWGDQPTEFHSYKIATGDTLNRKLKRFTNFYSIPLITVSDDEDDEATCHCIRATLAQYIGRHSTLAILILKKLFGHSNNLMPDKYLRHNPYVKKAREQQLEKMHSETAHSIATSIARKEVAGNRGEELLKGAEILKDKIKLENKSLTEMDVHRELIDVLQEIILEDIKNEQTQTLLTPVGVICMRATNQSNDSPCAASVNKAERDRAGVSRAIFGALPQLPNPAACVGLDCPDALATKTYSLPLLRQFDWYTNVYRHWTDEKRSVDEDASYFVRTYYPIILANDMLSEAEAFKKKYGPELRKLYGDIRAEGHFDA